MASSTKISRTSGAGQSRFPRSTAAARRTGRTSAGGQGRFARSTSSPRKSIPVQGLRRRGQPQPTGLKKVLSSVLPAATAKKATPSSKKGKAGGLALVAAAAGMAFKNRGKIAELRKKDSHVESTGSDNAVAPPGTPVV